jgi:hypothetical protein
MERLPRQCLSAPDTSRNTSLFGTRPEIVRIWISLYTPQKDEHSPEMLTPAQREGVATQLASLQSRYPKLLANEGISKAIRIPPAGPEECMFARLSTNSADLATHVDQGSNNALRSSNT